MTGRRRVVALIGVAAFLAWLNLQYPAPTGLVKLSERSAALLATAQPGSLGRHVANLQDMPLPIAAVGSLDRPMLEPADSDPFGLVVVTKPALPVVPTSIAAAMPTLAAPIPPTPTAPPLNMGFAGRMTAPDGTQIVYVAFGETSLAITAGQTLPNGYRVEAINPRAVELRYPPLNTTARLDLPAPPKYETR